uniref:Uncharacterized protein n=1 Tax=Oryza brachyantha TaxID=4533 RepID=J3MTA0_ORYBR
MVSKKCKAVHQASVWPLTEPVKPKDFIHHRILPAIHKNNRASQETLGNSAHRNQIGSQGKQHRIPDEHTTKNLNHSARRKIPAKAQILHHHHRHRSGHAGIQSWEGKNEQGKRGGEIEMSRYRCRLRVARRWPVASFARWKGQRRGRGGAGALAFYGGSSLEMAMAMATAAGGVRPRKQRAPAPSVPAWTRCMVFSCGLTGSQEFRLSFALGKRQFALVWLLGVWN